MSDERVALVTGSASGIGEAVARRLAADGIRVVINSARSVEAGMKVASSLRGGLYLQADISVEDQVQRLVADTVERCGRLDVLVNNAGTTTPIPHRDLAAATPQVWRDILEINLIGTWQTTVAAMPHLVASGNGSVVNISSISGSRPSGSSIPYAVSKAAIEHLTRLLARAVGPEVRVNAVAPGLTETPWMSRAPEFASVAEQYRKLAPLRRVGLPEDVARAVASFIDSVYITGEVLLVDGGAHLVA